MNKRIEKLVQKTLAGEMHVYPWEVDSASEWRDIGTPQAIKISADCSLESPRNGRHFDIEIEISF